MKYLMIGAGGTGGCLGAFFARSGRDVTLIARGEQLAAINRDGLHVDAPSGAFTVRPAAFTTEEYEGRPDVIFVCVKSYSIDDIIPFLARISDRHTTIIPLLNIYSTADKLHRALPEPLTAAGCIYIAANIASPGRLVMHGNIFRVICGPLSPDSRAASLESAADDLAVSGVTPSISSDIRRDCLLKFSYVASQAACGLKYGVTAGAMQIPGEERNFFIELIREIDALARAMGIDFGEDIVKRNLAILKNLSPDSSTSLQRDIVAGGPSEKEGLIFEPLARGRELGVDMPAFACVAALLGDEGGQTGV